MFPGFNRLLAGAFLALATGVRSNAGDVDIPEYAAKAAYLYNFSLYTDWPVAPADGFHLCVAGRVPGGNGIDALAGKLLRGQPIVVDHLDGSAGIGACHLVYVGALSAGQRASLFAGLARLPVLTVGEDEDPATMIRLLANGRRFAFEIDLDKVRLAGLVISSRLLHLAQFKR